MKNAIGTAIGAFALVVAVTTPASASIIEFYEGNNCTQKKLGGLNTAEHLSTGKDKVIILNRDIIRVMGIPMSNAHPWNDEARSARITSNWRDEREPRTSYVSIFDNPNASKGDDWARIHIRDATLIPPEGVCVGSFERNFSREGIYLERYPHNGLDGKVSVVNSWCNSACRANLTPDSNAAATTPKLVITRRAKGGKKLSPRAARILKRRSEQ